MTKFSVTRLRAAGAATAAAAGISTVAAIALAPAPVLADSSVQSSAFGLSATGAIPIPATPTVESSGPLVTKNLGSLPSNPAITGSLLDVQAQADTAKASVSKLSIGGPTGINASLLDAACKGSTGNADVGTLQIAGQPEQTGGAPANTQIQVPPGASAIVSVTINKQVPNSSGGVTVTALEATVKVPNSPVNEKVDVSQANCSAGAGTTGSGATPPSAPAPNPQQGNLPVTG